MTVQLFLDHSVLCTYDTINVGPFQHPSPCQMQPHGNHSASPATHLLSVFIDLSALGTSGQLQGDNMGPLVTAS